MADDISKLMVKDGDTVTRYGLNVAVRRYQLANWIGGQGATTSSATTRAAAPLP